MEDDELYDKIDNIVANIATAVVVGIFCIGLAVGYYIGRHSNFKTKQRLGPVVIITTNDGVSDTTYYYKKSR